jgi:hypothetical protein
MDNEIRPNKAELEFLRISYDKFLDLFECIFEDSFWEKSPRDRLSLIAQCFAIYSELLKYPPISTFIVQLKTERPPMESEIADELFKFVRNVIAHFPFFDSWDEVFINNRIANWDRDGQSIDKFLKKYQGKKELHYRFWEPKIKRMTYLSVKFPNRYTEGTNIFLKEIFEEKAGVKFSLILMRNVLGSQIESIGNKLDDYVIMAAVGNSR